MDHTAHEDGSALKATAARRRPWGAARLMVVMIAAFFVLHERRGHIAGFWPTLLPLACPVMHLFHRHRGHGSRTEKE